MAAQALIVFTQGPNSDIGGRALVGTLSDGPVTVTNTNNTEVASWGIELLEAPPGSVLAAGSLGAGVSSTPTAIFLPDVPGSYRIRTTVYGSGGNTDIDIRVFAIPLPKKKLILPPYQKNPDPLPLPSSGAPTAKPDEMNFEGQARGYAGDLDPDRKLFHQALQIIDDVISLPALDDASAGDVLVVVVHDYDEPIALGFDGVRGWVLDSNYGVDGVAALSALDLEQNRATAYFGSTPSTDRFEGLVLDSSGFWIAITETGATDTYLRKFNILNETYGPRYNVHTTAARGIAYGAVSGTDFIWLLSADQLTRVVPTTPSGPFTTAALTNAIDVLFDATTSHYGDGLPRVWVVDVGLPGVHRLSGAPAVDTSVSMVGTTPRALTITSAGIFVLAIDTVATQAKIYKVAFNPAAVASSNNSINSVFSMAGGGDIFDITYDVANNKLFVYGKNASGQGVLARVNPTSLDVENSVVVSSDSLQSGAALPRIEVFRGSVWVPVMNPAGAGSVIRVNPTSLTITAALPGFKEAVFDPSAGGGAALSNAAPQPIGTVDAGIAITASRADHIHAHGDQPGGSLHADVVSGGASGFMPGATAAQIARNTGYRSVVHTTGDATDVLTPASVRYQRLDMTGGGTYTYELALTGSPVTGSEFIIDVSIAPAVTGGLEIKNGVAGTVLVSVSELLVTRDLVFSAVFNGTAWVVSLVSDGNVFDEDTNYASPDILNSGSQTGYGPEKANFDHTHAHGNRSGGTLHSVATVSTNGFQVAADFKKQLDGGGVAYRTKAALSVIVAGAYTDLVDGATTDIAVAASTTTLVEVHVACYRKVVGTTESGGSTSRTAFHGTFRAEVLRDADNPTTPLVTIEPSSGDTVWVLSSTSGSQILLKPVAVSGGFKLQVFADQVEAGDFGFLTVSSGTLNIAATINTYPVATIA